MGKMKKTSQMTAAEILEKFQAVVSGPNATRGSDAIKHIENLSTLFGFRPSDEILDCVWRFNVWRPETLPFAFQVLDACIWAKRFDLADALLERAFNGYAAGSPELFQVIGKGLSLGADYIIANKLDGAELLVEMALIHFPSGSPEHGKASEMLSELVKLRWYDPETECDEGFGNFGRC